MFHRIQHLRIIPSRVKSRLPDAGVWNLVANFPKDVRCHVRRSGLVAQSFTAKAIRLGTTTAIGSATYVRHRW